MLLVTTPRRRDKSAFVSESVALRISSIISSFSFKKAANSAAGSSWACVGGADAAAGVCTPSWLAMLDACGGCEKTTRLDEGAQHGGGEQSVFLAVSFSSRFVNRTHAYLLGVRENNTIR